MVGASRHNLTPGKGSIVTNEVAPGLVRQPTNRYKSDNFQSYFFELQKICFKLSAC